jgi:hypothetical protein
MQIINIILYEAMIFIIYTLYKYIYIHHIKILKYILYTIKNYI